MRIKLIIQSLSLYLLFTLGAVLATDVEEELKNKIPISQLYNPGNFEFFKKLPIELVRIILSSAAYSPHDLMQWSGVNQRFRIAVTGYPINITGKMGETLEDYKKKHCGFSDQEIAGIRDIEKGFHLNINKDTVSKIIYIQQETYVIEENGEKIFLDKIPSYVLYNLANRFKDVPYYHWNMITKTKSKQLSLSIFPNEEDYFKNLIQQFKNDDYQVQQLELNFVGHSIHFLKELIPKLRNIQVKHSDFIKYNELFEVVIIDSSDLILSFKQGKFDSLLIKYDTYISNDAFVKLLTYLNLNTFKTLSVDLGHITAEDIKTIFAKGITSHRLNFMNCNFSRDVITQFLDGLANNKHCINEFKVVSDTVNNNLIDEYARRQITKLIRGSGIKDFSVKGLGSDTGVELYFKYN